MSRLSRIEFNKQFEKHFKMHLRPEWIDNLLTVIRNDKSISFNTLSFDDYLHRQYGDYEDTGKSMANIIEEKYGTSARKLIEDHL